MTFPVIMVLAVSASGALLCGTIFYCSYISHHKFPRIWRVERNKVLNADLPRHAPRRFSEGGGVIVMRDFPRLPRDSPRDLESGQSEAAQGNVVPAHVAPVAKPLKSSKESLGSIKGDGGGFVEYDGSEEKEEKKSKLGSMKMSKLFKFGKKDKDKKEEEDVPRKSIDDFLAAPLHGTSPWDPTRTDISTPGLFPDIPAPPHAYKSTNYGRYNSTAKTPHDEAADVRLRALGDDGKAADVWDKINKRESLVKTKVDEGVKPHDKKEPEKFEEVELDATPPSSQEKNHVVGTDSESEDDSESESEKDDRESEKDHSSSSGSGSDSSDDEEDDEEDSDDETAVAAAEEEREVTMTVQH